MIRSPGSNSTYSYIPEEPGLWRPEDALCTVGVEELDLGDYGLLGHVTQLVHHVRTEPGTNNNVLYILN